MLESGPKTPEATMKLKLDGIILYLGRLRKDGYRNIERVRLLDNRMLLSRLRKAKIPAQMIGTRLIVQPENPNQMTFLKIWEATG